MTPAERVKRLDDFQHEIRLVRLVDALRSVNATLPGAPKDLPFLLDEETLSSGLNFTFDTDIGSIVFLGEVQGVRNYEECLKDSNAFELFDVPCRVLSLEKLIAAKRSAGRPRELVALAELEAIPEHRQKNGIEEP